MAKDQIAHDLMLYHLLKRVPPIPADLVTFAQAFAMGAHYGIDQRRKYTDEPYIVHPAEVVQILRSVGASDEELAAGWLHDVPEDTDTPLPVIFNVFGAGVGVIVEGMTDAATIPTPAARKKTAIELVEAVFGLKAGQLLNRMPVRRDLPTGPNRETRKAATIKRLAAADAKTQNVKCADLISNHKDISNFDPDFAVVYRHEARALLVVLTKANPILRNRLAAILEN
jgi:(p)ppGpp synthase/HD superfamily hydrolase